MKISINKTSVLILTTTYPAGSILYSINGNKVAFLHDSTLTSLTNGHIEYKLVINEETNQPFSTIDELRTFLKENFKGANGNGGAVSMETFTMPTLKDWKAPNAANFEGPIIGGKVNMMRHATPKVRVLMPIQKKEDLLIPNTGSELGQGNSLTDYPTSDALYGTTAVKYRSDRQLWNVTNAVPLATPVDVRGGMIRINIKPLLNMNTTGALNIQLHSYGTPAAPTANYHSTDNGNFGLLTESMSSFDGEGVWQTKMIPLKYFSPQGDGADLTAIKFVRIGVMYANNNGAARTEFLLGNIEFVANALTKAKCIITFDDAHISQYTYAAAQMGRYGFPGIIYASPLAVVGTSSDRMNVNQLLSLQSRGWQMASQSHTTEDIAMINAMTEVEKTAFYTRMRNLQNALGLYGGADGSYFGNIGAQSLENYKSLRQHFRTLRTFSGGQSGGDPIPFGEMYPFGDPYYLRCLNGATGGYSLQRLKDHLDQAIANKGLAMFCWHNELAAPGAARTAFEGLLAYGDTKRAEIDFCTLDDLPYL